jgi:branched-chain amino acid transport system substrate-binding protein
MRSVRVRSYLRLILLFASVIAASEIGDTAPADRAGAVRQIATDVGRVLGSASACREISPLRIKSMADRISILIVDSALRSDELTSIWQSYNQSNVDGQRAITSKRLTCPAAERALADLEKMVNPAPTGGVVAGNAPPPSRTATNEPPAPPPVLGGAALPPPPRTPAGTTTVATAPNTFAARLPLANAAPARGVTETEIRFGMSAPFSGSAKELGRNMKQGIETAFNVVNDAGGIHGRQLRLIAADDGYEPNRTAETMKQLYVLEYKSALASYFPGENPDYVSLEGYIAANVLIDALKRTGPQLDTERLVEGLESMRDVDLGLGTLVNCGRTEHQFLHKVWGTQLDANGRYQPIELQ